MGSREARARARRAHSRRCSRFGSSLDSQRVSLEALEDRLLLSGSPVAGLDGLAPALVDHGPTLAEPAEPSGATGTPAADMDARTDGLPGGLSGGAPSGGPVARAAELGANRYMAYDHWGGTWCDAEKSFCNTEDDSLLCWAAAASNVLEWTGWGHVAGMSTTDEMFDHFRDHWTNARGSEMCAWDWWLDGTNPTQGWAGSQEDVDGGGGFYRSADFGDYFHSQVTNSRAMSAVDEYLHNGYGVVLTIHGHGSHVITCWGLDYANAVTMDSAGDYTGVWVTDSDDDRLSTSQPDRLQRYAVDFHDGRWYLQDYYGLDDCYIATVSGLARPDADTPADARVSAKTSRRRAPAPNDHVDTSRRVVQALRMLWHQRDPVSRRAPGALGSPSSDPNFGWAFSVGSSGRAAGEAIATDAHGNRYVCGWMDGTVQLNTGEGEITSSHSTYRDILVAKLSPDGELIWGHAIGGPDKEEAEGIAVDRDGNVYITGWFAGTADLDPGPHTFNLTSAGDTGAFVLKLDPTGKFLWARAIGGTSEDVARDIALGADGRVHLTGSFCGTVDFDPGPGSCVLTSTGTHFPHAGNQDVFVCTLDAGGELVWAQTMGGPGHDEAKDVAVDRSGNVYTTGRFELAAAFDPDSDVFNLFSAGGDDIFVSKLDSGGRFVWARAMGGTSDDEARSIALDGLGNVYTTGAFHGTADFDPDLGTVANLTSAGGDDVFVSRLDARGRFVWAAGMGGPSDDRASGIALDASGNVYTTGLFEDTADFDPGRRTARLTSAGERDVFVSQLDARGRFVWARSLGGPSGDLGRDVAVDNAGRVHTTGWFEGTADFDPGPAEAGLFAARKSAFVSTLDSSGADARASAFVGSWRDEVRACTTDRSGNVYIVGRFSGTEDFDPHDSTSLLCAAEGSFVAKYTTRGELVWARALGGEGADGIAVDRAGNVHVVGTFRGTGDFDPGTATFDLTSAGDTDVFIAKLDRAGNFLWAGALGGPGAEFAGGIATDTGGNVYATGSFSGTADFDPSRTIRNLTSAGGTDVFVVKLDSGGELAWARRAGAWSGDAGRGIAVDHRGNVYTTGTFQRTVDFDPGSATYSLAAGSADAFLWKLDSAGRFVWARAMGGTRNDSATAITVDNACNVYATGTFQETAAFGPGGRNTLTCTGVVDVFVTKHSARGDLRWARAIGGTDPADITVDSAGNVFTTGAFLYRDDFDPGPGTFHLTNCNPGTTDIYVSKLDAWGRFAWAGTVAASSGYDDPGGIAIDHLGRLYITGGFQGTVDMNPRAGTSSLSARPYSIFVTKWVDAPSALPESVRAERDPISPIASPWWAGSARRPMSAAGAKSSFAHQPLRRPGFQRAGSSRTAANQIPREARSQLDQAADLYFAGARMPDALDAERMAMDVEVERLARAILTEDAVSFGGLNARDFRALPVTDLLHLLKR